MNKEQELKEALWDIYKRYEVLNPLNRNNSYLKINVRVALEALVKCYPETEYYKILLEQLRKP